MLTSTSCEIISKKKSPEKCFWNYTNLPGGGWGGAKSEPPAGPVRSRAVRGPEPHEGISWEVSGTCEREAESHDQPATSCTLPVPTLRISPSSSANVSTVSEAVTAGAAYVRR